MHHNTLNRLFPTKDEQKLLNRERLYVQVASVIGEAMRDEKLTQTELAAKIRVSPGRVSQILSGDKNLRLSTLADILFELDCALDMTTRPINDDPCHYVRLRTQSVPTQWSEEADHWPNEVAGRIGATGCLMNSRGRLAG